MVRLTWLRRAAALALRGVAAAAASLPAVQAAPVQIAQAIDPQVVGTWVNQTMNHQGGTVRWIWEIRPDGSYDFRAEGAGAPPPHGGRVTAANGQWSLQAARGQPGWTDSGSYQIVGGDFVFFVGRLGPGTWQRMAGAPAPAAAAASWPRGLVEMAARARTLARARLPDAALYEIDLQRADGGAAAGAPTHDHRFFFLSPRDGSTVTVMPFNPAGEVWPGGAIDASRRPALPDRFLDFAEVERRAQLLGMRGAAMRGTLSEAPADPWPSWLLWPPSGRAFRLNATAGPPALRPDPAPLADALGQAVDHLATLVGMLGTPGRHYDPQTGPAEQTAGIVGRAGLWVEGIGRQARSGLLVYRDRAAATAHLETMMAGAGRMRFSMPRRWSDSGIGAVEARCAIEFTANQVLHARCAWLHPVLPAIATALVEWPPQATVIDREMDRMIDRAAFPLTMAAAFFLTDLLQAR